MTFGELKAGDVIEWGEVIDLVLEATGAEQDDVVEIRLLDLEHGEVWTIKRARGMVIPYHKVHVA